MLASAWHYIVEHPDRFGAALWRHISLSAVALAIAAAIAIPLGIWLARRTRYALVAINAANVGRTLPSLAVLALMMPLLGTGFTPALFALTLLALPPILINTYAAVRQVDPDVIDAARGMGMSRREILWKVELPLAMPVIVAGLRISAVTVISVTVVAAYVNAGGLGSIIFNGIASDYPPKIVTGALAACLLAIAVDVSLAALERRLKSRRAVA